MLDELAHRRRDFLPGLPILLADGQWWTFPAPPGRVASGAVAPGESAGFGPDYAALVAAVCEAEDQVERLRAELALVIHLLERNYVLTPDALFDLLALSPGVPALAAMQEEFHRLSLEHVLQPRESAAAVPSHETPARAIPAAPEAESRRHRVLTAILSTFFRKGTSL